MSGTENLKLILTVISGVCWTIVYLEGIRVGFRDKSYAIPFDALALNFAWELLYTIFGLPPNRFERFSTPLKRLADSSMVADQLAERACRKKDFSV